MSSTLPNVPVHKDVPICWHGRSGCADLSDFKMPLTGRLYADAVDVGFYVESPRTGLRKLFSEAKIERDVEGEPVSYHYESSDGFTITVWND